MEKYNYRISAIIKGTDIVADTSISRFVNDVTENEIRQIAKQHETRMRGFYGDRVVRIEIVKYKYIRS